MIKLRKTKRWREKGMSATLRLPGLRKFLLFVAGVWTLVRVLLDHTQAAPFYTDFWLLPACACIAFAIHDALFRNRFQFEDGMFIFSKGSLKFSKEVCVPISEIAQFRVVQQAPYPSSVELVLRDGSARTLSLQLHEIVLYSPRHLGRPPIPVGGVPNIEDYMEIASWLNDTLDRALHEGGGYRVAPGQVTSPEVALGEPIEPTSNDAIDAAHAAQRGKTR